ncbi:unknown protein [Seminavis robusta]|uniref:Uncharacterized protein n=1 Tax=Seminavis robusta TaxID=568900 RepID=A0A9N8EQ00_9STRA|nr:unknown protein [Seminavis robusta]|eukprot:Sro1635_g287520.1 n/a (116) ;mRNA; r:4781-5128
MFATEGHFRLAANKYLTQRRNRYFKSNFGASPNVCAVTWNMFGLGDDNGGVEFKYLLWALLFLKTYAVLSVLASAVGVTANTFRKYLWPMVGRIAGLAPKVVSFLSCRLRLTTMH